ncbi:MFS transporter [Streptomyces sp. NPDC021020]|uniref:MFS transporter n=1 Tax=Streptomyces sp. NPDC021020 TaxID=3365109 RepID=UPI0037B5A73F
MRSYAALLRTPEIRVPLLATVLGALPLGMLGLALLLYARGLSGSFAAGGLATGAFGLGNALGITAQGRLMDRHGQARVIVPAGVACALGSVALVAAPPSAHRTAFTVAACAGLGLCVPATTGAMRALLAALVPDPGARRAGYALLAVLFQLAVLGGPLLTALLLALAGPGAAVLSGGLLAGAAAALFGSSRACRSRRPARSGRHSGAGTGRGLAVLLALTAGTGVSGGMTAVAVPAAALATGSAAASGALMAVSAAGEVAAGLVYGALPVRWTAPARILPLTLAAAAAAVGLAAWAAPVLVALFPALFLVGACSGPSAIAASALLDTLAPRAALTRAYTLMVGCYLVGGAAGNAVGGALVQRLDSRGCLGAAAGWLALLLVAALRGRRELGAQEV